MDLYKEFREDTVENVLHRHKLTLDEAFDICLHHNGGKEVLPEKKTTFIQEVHGKYRIRKQFGKKLMVFGYYNTLDDAIAVRDALIEDGWRFFRLFDICEELGVELVE